MRGRPRKLRPSARFALEVPATTIPRAAFRHPVESNPRPVKRRQQRFRHPARFVVLSETIFSGRCGLKMRLCAIGRRRTVPSDRHSTNSACFHQHKPISQHREPAQTRFTVLVSRAKPHFGSTSRPKSGSGGSVSKVGVRIVLMRCGPEGPPG